MRRLLHSGHRMSIRRRATRGRDWCRSSARVSILLRRRTMSEQSPADFERVRNEQREFWNESAPGWKQLFFMLDRAAQHVSDRLVELARIKPGDRVLDIATGSGEPGITAARKVGPDGLVVATDMSPKMLELAKERAAGLGIHNMKFVETGAEALEIEERNFDA